MSDRRETKRFGGIFLLAALLFLCAMIFTSDVKVEAATTGFVTRNGTTYYIKPNGQYHKGWLTLNGKKYYFFETGKMAKGWVKNSQGKYYYFNNKNGVMYTGWVKSRTNTRYFRTNGVMATGLLKISGKYYYFNASNGYMIKGWVTDKKSGRKRYFDGSDGHMLMGWITTGTNERYFSQKTGYMYTGWNTTNGKTRYFNPSTGVMATGLKKIDSDSYLFKSTDGVMITGWYTTDAGEKYYFDPETGAMVTGSRVIDGQECVFSSTGVFTGYADGKGSSDVKPTGTKTIKNLFLAALQPVGSTLYVYGGGHSSDATRTGLNPAWEAAYNSGSYAAGLDCSGYIGWSVYQVMKKMSTGWSGSMIDLYVSRDWGSKALLSSVEELQPGDILAHSDHIWMVLGTCSDGSVVILHSSGTAGPQLAGTGGQAVELVRTYMSRYSGYNKYTYDIYSGTWNSPYNGYYGSTYVFRWNRNTLKDPEGFTNMTADQILLNLSAAIGNK